MGFHTNWDRVSLLFSLQLKALQSLTQFLNRSGLLCCYISHASRSCGSAAWLALRGCQSGAWYTCGIAPRLGVSPRLGYSRARSLSGRGLRPVVMLVQPVSTRVSRPVVGWGWWCSAIIAHGARPRRGVLESLCVSVSPSSTADVSAAAYETSPAPVPVGIGSPKCSGTSPTTISERKAFSSSPRGSTSWSSSTLGSSSLLWGGIASLAVGVKSFVQLQEAWKTRLLIQLANHFLHSVYRPVSVGHLLHEVLAQTLFCITIEAIQLDWFGVQHQLHKLHLSFGSRDCSGGISLRRGLIRLWNGGEPRRASTSSVSGGGANPFPCWWFAWMGGSSLLAFRGRNFRLGLQSGLSGPRALRDREPSREGLVDGYIGQGAC